MRSENIKPYDMQKMTGHVNSNQQTDNDSRNEKKWIANYKEFLSYKNEPKCDSCKFKIECDLSLIVHTCLLHNVKPLHLSDEDKLELWESFMKLYKEKLLDE